MYIIKSILTHNPANIRFENISSLGYIPENTFSQIKKQAYKPGCINPSRDLESLSFDRVNIGTVAPRAFNELKDLHNFSWNAVKVDRLQHLAVQLEFNNAGNFSIRKSNLEVCEHLAFKIVGKYGEFVKNSFVDLFPSSINGTVDTFLFELNTVNNLQSYGISILAQNVKMIDNRFEYLRAGAFERISPGLLQDSQRNFGTLKFSYEFSHNYLNFMDAGSINPDMISYNNVAADIKWTRNSLFCSCENLGWLLSGIGHGYGSKLLQDFYQTVMDDGYKNMCSYTSCDLSLKEAGRLLVEGSCLQNITAENLCTAKEDVYMTRAITNDKTTQMPFETISGSSKVHTFYFRFTIFFLSNSIILKLIL